MMNNLIINGMGCPVSGGRLVLEKMIESCPSNYNLKIIIPFREPLHLKRDNRKFIYLKHSIWGKYLRPLIDIYINILMFIDQKSYLINLSNYGICFFKRSVLYFHNPILLDLNEKSGYGSGKSNFLVRRALHQSLMNSSLIIVQTNHVQTQLENYKENYGLKITGVIKVIKPAHILSELEVLETQKKPETINLFYPAKHFPHKNIDLAVDTVKGLGDTTLTLTTDDEFIDENISFLGPITYEEVIKNYILSDALLFTSERETLGLPLLEALQYEKPAILPDLPYAREIFGDSAVYFDRFTKESIHSSIELLRKDYSYFRKKVKEHKGVILNKRKTWEQHWEIIFEHIKEHHFFSKDRIL